MDIFPHTPLHSVNPRDPTASESTTRRKYQRTAALTDAEPAPAAFRRPTLPASATRPAGGASGGVERRPSITTRRRSTLRENVRLPSGPREFPSPGKRYVAFYAVPPERERARRGY